MPAAENAVSRERGFAAGRCACLRGGGWPQKPSRVRARLRNRVSPL